MTDEASETPFSGRALLIEDNAIVALDAQEMLSAMGFDPVDMTASVAEAIQLAQTHSYAIAVVDLVVKDGSSQPAIEHLAKTGVPFVIASGYFDPAASPALKAPRVTKPYDDITLRAALMEAGGQTARGR